MHNQVISVLQEKGGAAKTTTLLIIATKMVMDGAKVAMIDTDQRENLTRFCKKEKLDIDYVYVDDEDMIKPTIRALKKKGYDAIFIDTEGYKSTLSGYVVANSNLIFIPTKADESNVICAARTYKTIQTVCDNFEKDIPSYVIMSDIDHDTNITKAMRATIEEHNIPTLDVNVGHATGFKEMLTTGLPPTRGAAKKHSESLICELQMKGMIDFYSKGKMKEASNG
jgi:chromosome partitioning protein